MSHFPTTICCALSGTNLGSSFFSIKKNSTEMGGGYKSSELGHEFFFGHF